MAIYEEGLRKAPKGLFCKPSSFLCFAKDVTIMLQLALSFINISE